MARSVSAEFKELWQKKQGVTDRRRVRVYRRYWNGSAFVNEATPQDLYEGDFVSMGEVPWSLDSPLQNVFRSPVVTLHLNNERNQWVESDASPSFFAADSVATSGYKLYKTLFVYQVGYKLNSGTVEWVTEFTGYAVSPKLTSRQGTAAIRLVSKSALRLQKSDAVAVAETFTLENCSPATGDGSNRTFKSTSTAVGRITDFQVNAASYDKSDYTVDNLNQVDGPNNDGKAVMTTDDAPGIIPAAGQTVKVSGIRWLRDQLINTLLTTIAQTAAGIDASELSINSVLLAGAATGSRTVDTAAEWAAELTDANCTDLALLGSLRRKWIKVDDFTDGDYTADPTWTVRVGSNFAISTNRLYTEAGPTVGGYQEITVAAPAKNTGTIGFEINMNFTGGFGGYNGGFVVPWLKSFSPGGTAGFAQGYGLWFRQDNAVFFGRWDGSSSIGFIFGDGGGGFNNLGGLSTTWTAATVERWSISRDANGVFKIYKGGSLVGTFTDTTYDTFSMFGYGSNADLGGQNAFAYLDNIYYTSEVEASDAPTNSTAVREYQFNLGATPTAMGLLVTLQDLNGGTVSYRTAGAPDSGGSPGAYDAYSAVSVNGQMNHTPRHWLKIEVTITPASGSFTSPNVHRMRAFFQTENVIVSIANLDGLTGEEAFERYAQLVDYETGDDPDGKRFFRSKDVTGDHVVHLDHEKAVVEVLDYDDGRDSVINVGRVKFNDFVEEYDGADAAEASPTSEQEHGRIGPSGGWIELTGVLLTNDLNLAAARARAIYERNYRPKRRIRAIVWVVPWLEVGDKVRFSVFDQPIMQHPVSSDPLYVAGSDFNVLDTPKNVLAADLDMKLLEYKPNYDTNLAEVLLEEVLA